MKYPSNKQHQQHPSHAADTRNRAIPEQLANRHCLALQKGKTDYRGQTQDAVRWALISAPLLVRLVQHSGISNAGF